MNLFPDLSLCVKIMKLCDTKKNNVRIRRAALLGISVVSLKNLFSCSAWREWSPQGKPPAMDENITNSTNGCALVQNISDLLLIETELPLSGEKQERQLN